MQFSRHFLTMPSRHTNISPDYIAFETVDVDWERPLSSHKKYLYDNRIIYFFLKKIVSLYEVAQVDDS